MSVSITVHPAAYSNINGDSDNTFGSKYVRVAWFEPLASGTSGTIALPSGAEVVLDAFAGGVDALVSTIENAWPSFASPATASGVVVAATLDAAGHWTLSGAPSAYPVALIYQYRTTLSDLDDTKMFGAALADNFQALSSGDIPTFAGVKLSGAEVLKHLVTPSNPPSGYSSAYFKEDGQLYTLSSVGAESPVGGSSVSAFTDLSDVPSSYTGEELNLVRVNAGGTALEFFTPSSDAPTSGTGTVVIDFGAYPGSNEASVTATGLTGISATSKAEAYVMGDDTTTGHTAADHRYLSQFVTFTCGTPGTNTVTVYARSIHKMQGQWAIRIVWTD
jgi:hypothetical protein